MISIIKKSILVATIFFGTLLVLSIWYWAITSGLVIGDKVGTGSGLSSAAWNRIIDAIFELDTRTTALTGAGKVLNVTAYKDCTRKVLGLSSSITMAQFAVNKISSTSTLIIQGAVCGFGNHSGSMTQWWKIGASAETIGQSLMYDENPHSKAFPAQAIISGYSTTGSQAMIFRYYAADNAANAPFLVHNPNTADDARLAQTCSVYTVFEVEQ